MNKLAIEEKKHNWHWSSTENRSKFAWFQYFTNGHQGSDYKTYSYWARAVRRVKK